jgi:hypothetical protein
MAAFEAPEALKLRSGLPCPGGDERGTLRHTWLEGRLLYEVRLDSQAWLNARAGDTLPEVLAGIPMRLERLQRFLFTMVEDFSPAHLVDQCRLAELEDSTKQLLREALHNTYVASGVIQPYRDALRQATDKFAETAAKAEAVWRTGDRERKAEFLAELETNAMALREALALPQGVVLP